MKLYVVGLPHFADALYLRQLFEPYGNVANVKLLAASTHTTLTFGVVEMFNEAEAWAATAALDFNEARGHTLLLILEGSELYEELAETFQKMNPRAGTLLGHGRDDIQPTRSASDDAMTTTSTILQPA